MRAPIVIGAALALTVAAGIAGTAVARHSTSTPAAHTTKHASSTSTSAAPLPAPRSTADTPAPTSAASTAPIPTAAPVTAAALAKLPLAQAGTEVYVGVPETITLTDAAGRTIYAQATLDELTQLPASQAADVLSHLPALAGYQDVYQLPVTLKILGILQPTGATASSTTGLTPRALSGFTVAVHPGDTPLLSSDTVTTAECQGLPATASEVAVGQSLSWCVHAFARAADPIPIGGQYQAAAGAYSAPLIWASKTFHGGPTIP